MSWFVGLWLTASFAEGLVSHHQTILAATNLPITTIPRIAPRIITGSSPQSLFGSLTSGTQLASSSSENNDDMSFVPETSFGAEVVPEGQRPVNEYLDMKRAPLFGWASNEVGANGLLLRLAIIYVAVFALV
jgi:hypothetical protein